MRKPTFSVSLCIFLSRHCLLSVNVNANGLNNLKTVTRLPERLWRHHDEATVKPTLMGDSSSS